MGVTITISVKSRGKETSFWDRIGPRVILRYVLFGALYGYFIVLPAVMMVSHLMLESQLGHGHMEYEIIFLEVNNAFSLQSLPWGLAFSFLGSVVGFYLGNMKRFYLREMERATGYSRRLEQAVDEKSRELHESEELFKTIVETGSSAEVGVVLFQDVQGKEAALRFVNYYMLKLLGYEKKELFTMSFFDLLRPKEVERVSSIYRKREAGEAIPHYETEVLTKDQKVIPIIIGSGMTDMNGNPTTVAFIRNISKQKEAEKALKNSYEELKTIDEVKDNIIMNVSHELRTPITIASSHIELALDEDDPVERAEQLRRAQSALMRQVGIIDNLIEIARVKKRKYWLNLEHIDLGDVASIVIGQMKTYALYKGIKMDRDMPEISVRADFSEIMRVFSNLLDNAIKFTPDGGHIRISGAKDDGTVTVSVADSGIGVPEIYREKVFERLFQVDASATRKYGGAGIGLSVAKDIVEAHDGRIWCMDNPGGGTIFYFTLPIGGPKENAT